MPAYCAECHVLKVAGDRCHRCGSTRQSITIEAEGCEAKVTLNGIDTVADQRPDGAREITHQTAAGARSRSIATSDTVTMEASNPIIGKRAQARAVRYLITSFASRGLDPEIIQEGDEQADKQGEDAKVR